MAETRELLDACVHCGFCLRPVPTYDLWGEEMDSPRGRIHLMNLLERGEIGWDETVAVHFDRCLGCLACVPACPSGVRYDLLIERTRAAPARARARGPAPGGWTRRWRRCSRTRGWLRALVVAACHWAAAAPARTAGASVRPARRAARAAPAPGASAG